MKIVIFGPPGSGKGTHAKFIEADWKTPQISTGDIFRRELKANTPLGAEARSYMDAGELVPDEVVVGMVRSRLSEPDVQDSFILDGFPRTVPQAEALDGFTKLDLVINIVAPDEKIIRRLTARRTCSDCDDVYNLTVKPPEVEGRCDKCGGKLVQREDDSDETVRNRLKVYHDQSAPVIEFYRGKGLVRDVISEGGIEAVRGKMRALITELSQRT